MKKRLKLLLLENTASDAESIKRELSKAGFDFEAQRVERREDFLKALAEFQPDLILAEDSLPQFTAPQALVLLKEEISQRKRAEQEIQKLAAFAQLNPNPVLEFAADGALSYFNDA